MNSEQKEIGNIDELRWVRVFTPLHIPKYLVEQVRDRDFSVEDFYKYHEINCLRDTEEGPTLNPFSHLYVLVNKDNVTKGFLWFSVDPLTKDLVIQTYSVDKSFWCKGTAVKKLADFVKDIRRKASLKKIYWITNYEKHSERYGFERSKSILMEWNEDKDKVIYDNCKSYGQSLQEKCYNQLKHHNKYIENEICKDPNIDE